MFKILKGSKNVWYGMHKDFFIYTGISQNSDDTAPPRYSFVIIKQLGSLFLYIRVIFSTLRTSQVQ